MKRNYCRHCNERIIKPGNTWSRIPTTIYMKAPVIWGTLETCTRNTEGHEPR